MDDTALRQRIEEIVAAALSRAGAIHEYHEAEVAEEIVGAIRTDAPARVRFRDLAEDRYECGEALGPAILLGKPYTIVRANHRLVATAGPLLTPGGCALGEDCACRERS